jgi:TRAP-type C4-dicarboxylate transport system permease small subunit
MHNTLKNIMAFLICLMTAAIFMQVLTRYALHISLPFLQMIIAFSMSWLTMIGAAVGLQTGKHFAIDMFSGKERRGIVKVFFILKRAMILSVILALIYGGWQFSLIGLVKEEPTTGLPEIYTYSSVLGGSLLMLVYFIKNSTPRQEN